MAKVYVFLANGFEEVEGLTVVDLLRRVGIETTMVSIMDTKQVTGSHKIKVEADTFFDESDYSDADMLVLPGGLPGTTNLAAHKGLVNLLIQFNREGRKISAICAAPSVLGMNGILEGKKAICFPGFEDKLLGATISGNMVEKSGNIITAKAMGVAIDFALCIIEDLLGSKVAEDVKKSIHFK